MAIRFDDLACAQAWFQSRTRQLLIDEVEPLLAQAEQVNTVTGLEFWFDHPKGMKGMGPPRPYKQFLLTLSVIYPLTLLVPLAVRRLIGGLPLLQPAWIERLIVAVIIVSLMTYVIMPRYTRWLAAWLRPLVGGPATVVVVPRPSLPTPAEVPWSGHAWWRDVVPLRGPPAWQSPTVPPR